MPHAFKETQPAATPAARKAAPRTAAGAGTPGREVLDRLLQGLPRRLQERIRLSGDHQILHYSGELKGDPELAALLALLKDWYGTRAKAHAPSSFAQELLAPQAASLQAGQARPFGQGGEAGQTGQPGPDETEVKRQLGQIIAQACAQGATDIHICDLGAYGLVRLRVMGEMRSLRETSGEEAGRLIAVAFNGLGQQSERPSFTSIERMDARIVDRRWLPAGVHAIRLHSEPVETGTERQGACLAMRILRPVSAGAGLGLEGRLSRLGFSQAQCRAFRELSLGSGLVLVAGPTGHGKSTVLANVMEAIVEEHPEKACLSVEDPPEYPLRGVMQIQVATNQAAGLAPGFRAQAYADAIAGAMRSDPDVLMIGEIRYPEAAQAAVDAALTGHAAWASVHARDAFAIPARLQLLLEGLLKEDPLVLLCQPGLLSGLVCQRLVPLLCPACAMPARLADRTLLARALPEDLQARLARAGIDPLAVRLRREGGCPACQGLGLAGSAACAEVVVVNDALRSLLREGRFAEARSLWLAQGGQTLLARALALVASGKADPGLCEERLGQALDSEAGPAAGEAGDRDGLAWPDGADGAEGLGREHWLTAGRAPCGTGCPGSSGGPGSPGGPGGKDGTGAAGLLDGHPVTAASLHARDEPAAPDACAGQDQPPDLQDLAGWNGLDGLVEPEGPEGAEGRRWLA